MNAKDGTFKITWNSNFKINLSSLLETLFISCYDENPYAPHHCIGEAAIPLDDIVQQRRYVQGTITKDVPLRIPNQNLLNNYHIKPSVLLKYDLIKFGTRESWRWRIVFFATFFINQGNQRSQFNFFSQSRTTELHSFLFAFFTYCFLMFSMLAFFYIFLFIYFKV